VAIGIEDGGAQRRQRDAVRDALYDASEDQRARRSGGDEDDQGQGAEQKRSEDHRPSPDIVRQRRHREECSEHTEGVAAEDHRDEERGEVEALLVEMVERCRRAGRGREADRRDNGIERGGARGEGPAPGPGDGGYGHVICLKLNNCVSRYRRGRALSANNLR
jgi:hypothetical protein